MSLAALLLPVPCGLGGARSDRTRRPSRCGCVDDITGAWPTTVSTRIRMTKNPNDAHYFERGNLSHVWADALRVVLAHGEAAPMIVSVTGFKDGVPEEEPAIRNALDT